MAVHVGTLRCMELNGVERDWELAIRAAEVRWTRAGYDESSFGRKVGLDRGTTWRIRTGRTTSPRVETLGEIEGGLGLPVGFLARVADHDVSWIERRVEDPHLRDWLLDEIATREQSAG